jgi:hypothetical protein
MNSLDMELFAFAKELAQARLNQTHTVLARIKDYQDQLFNDSMKAHRNTLITKCAKLINEEEVNSLKHLPMNATLGIFKPSGHKGPVTM